MTSGRGATATRPEPSCEGRVADGVNPSGETLVAGLNMAVPDQQNVIDLTVAFISGNLSAVEALLERSAAPAGLLMAPHQHGRDHCG